MITRADLPLAADAPPDAPVPGRWRAVVAPEFRAAAAEHGLESGSFLLPCAVFPGWRWRAIALEPDAARRYLPPLEAADDEAREHLAKFTAARARAGKTAEPAQGRHLPIPAPAPAGLAPEPLSLWRRAVVLVAAFFAGLVRRLRGGS